MHSLHRDLDTSVTYLYDGHATWLEVCINRRTAITACTLTQNSATALLPRKIDREIIAVE